MPAVPSAQSRDHETISEKIDRYDPSRDLPSNGGHTPFEEFCTTANPRSARSQTVQDFADSRKATNFFQYFKDSKTTGDTNRSIELTIRDFIVWARKHCLTAQQKADFIVSVLRDSARTLFFNAAKDDMRFDELTMMMIDEYNTDARHLQMQRKLEILRLDRYMADHSHTIEDEDLTESVKLVDRLTPQCQSHVQSDANKTNVLPRAVLCFSWFLIPTRNSITGKYRFNGCVTALPEHFQLANEVFSATSAAQERLQNPSDRTYHQRYG